MGDVIGQILPTALGVAISPVPIIAVILMLLAPRARASSFGFLTGWVAGIVIATSVFVLLAGVVETSDDGPSAVVGWIKLAIGALLLAAAGKQFQGRPRHGEQAALPKWMSAVDSMTPRRALGLGALLSGVNPKNLGLCLAAGATVGSSGISTGGTVVSVAVFTLLAASTIAVPVVAYAVASDRMAKPLDAVRRWLVEENAVIMAVLLTVLGVTLVGNGISAIA